METQCHICGETTALDTRATETYGEPACLDCAVTNHKAHDPCDHDDDSCPWTWTR